MSKPQNRYVFQVYWTNHYTNPPDNLPRILWQVESDRHRPTEEQEKIRDELIASSPPGYGRGWTCYSPPAKQWSLETKQRVRRSRLEKRLRLKYSIPLLYEEAYAEAIAKKPEYYGAE